MRKERDKAMRRLATGWVILAVGAVLLGTSSAPAQVLLPGNRPALSPWFNLYQRRGGPLDNYHMFVRPQIELSNTLQRQQANIQNNNTGVAALDQEVTQLRGPVRPTGTASVFMYYSHYYPLQGGVNRAMPGAIGFRRSLAR
jgi:hypothetical protein